MICITMVTYKLPPRLVFYYVQRIVQGHSVTFSSYLTESATIPEILQDDTFTADSDMKSRVVLNIM